MMTLPKATASQGPERPPPPPPSEKGALTAAIATTALVLLAWLALTFFARPVAERLHEWADAATFAIGADVLPGPRR